MVQDSWWRRRVCTPRIQKWALSCHVLMIARHLTRLLHAYVEFQKLQELLWRLLEEGRCRQRQNQQTPSNSGCFHSWSKQLQLRDERCPERKVCGSRRNLRQLCRMSSRHYLVSAFLAPSYRSFHKSPGILYQASYCIKCNGTRQTTRRSLRLATIAATASGHL